MDRRKGFDLYHTEIVIIRKEVCPTSKFENIDQVTFKTKHFVKRTRFIITTCCLPSGHNNVETTSKQRRSLTLQQCRNLVENECFNDVVLSPCFRRHLIMIFQRFPINHKSTLFRHQ